MEITTIEDINGKLWAYDRLNKENSKDNQVFTDGVYYFHLNKFSKWKVKAISYDYGEHYEPYKDNERK